MITSCQTEKEYDVDTRYLFIENKNVFEQKDCFNLLNDKERSSLWLSKIAQLKHLKLPDEHFNLINELVIQLKKHGYNELYLIKSFLSIAEKLFSEIPSEDIYQMLFTLEDYNFSKDGYHFESGFYSFDPSDFLMEEQRVKKTSKTRKRRACN